MHVANIQTVNMHAVNMSVVNMSVVNMHEGTMRVLNMWNHARKGAKEFLANIVVIIVALIIKNSEFLYVGDGYVALFFG